MLKEPEVVVPSSPAKARQGYELTRIYSALVAQDRAPGRVIRVKVDIRRDFYDFQSHYRTYQLTPSGWVFLHSIPNEAPECKAMPSPVSWGAGCISAIEAMADRLVNESYKILEFS